VGDLNGDGCDEVAFQHSNNGISVVFGFDAGGARCGGRTVLSRVSIDGFSGLNPGTWRMGLAIAPAGRFLGDARKFLAVAAQTFTFDEKSQPAVVLFDGAEVTALRPASGEVTVFGFGDGLNPIPVVPRNGVLAISSLAGNVDLTGDGYPDLVVGAATHTYASSGGGAVYVLSGAGGKWGYLEPLFAAAGDISERSGFGQVISLAPAKGAVPPGLVIGAPNSFRSGTQNGTAFSVPLGLQ
jgi:hypothetical protein